MTPHFSDSHFDEDVAVTGYERLDRIEGTKPYLHTYVSPDVLKAIDEKKPKHSDYLNGRLIPLEAPNAILILVYEAIVDKEIRETVRLIVCLEKEDDSVVCYNLCK